jgi:hypothetical protein
LNPLRSFDTTDWQDHPDYTVIIEMIPLSFLPDKAGDDGTNGLGDDQIFCGRPSRKEVGFQHQECLKRAGSVHQPSNSRSLRREGREERNQKMFTGRHLPGIGNRIKAFKVLLKIDADLFFL